MTLRMPPEIYIGINHIDIWGPQTLHQKLYRHCQTAVEGEHGSSPRHAQVNPAQAVTSRLDRPSPRALRSKIKVILELVVLVLTYSEKALTYKKPSYIIIYYKNLFEELGSCLSPRFGSYCNFNSSLFLWTFAIKFF